MERCTIELHNADCMEVMARYPDGYFDLAIVDPPYGIGADIAQNNAAIQREKAKGKSKAGRGWKKYKTTDWDNEKPSSSYWESLFAKSKMQIVWGGNYFTDFLPPSMGWRVWNKMQRNFSLADGELAWCSWECALRIFDFSRGGALADANSSGGRNHPTQKPVELYKWLYANDAKPGMKILDTHLGSGSNAIAAYDMDMSLFVGCELDTDYYTAAKARIDQHCNQQRLF